MLIDGAAVAHYYVNYLDNALENAAVRVEETIAAIKSSSVIL